ncbi:MAG: hypothetical protein QOG48_2500, partial [Verrucomicrobiota bacterium]
GFSSGPSISLDGRYVTFHSAASNLVAGDTNNAEDVFLHDRVARITERISVAADGGQATTDSYGPSVSADGRYVAFLSYARLVSGGSSGIFVRDRGGEVSVLKPLAVSQLPEGIAVSGLATFSGAVISSASDPTGDATPGLLGPIADTDLTGASVTYRPEQQDLLVRLRGVTAAPGTVKCTVNSNFVTVCEQGGGAPGAISPGVAYRRTLYGIDFQLNGVSYEIRARGESKFVVDAWVSDLGVHETRTYVDPAYVALYRCNPTCTEQTILQGAMGATGVEFFTSVSLSALGASEGTTLSAIQAFTAREETSLQAREIIDTANLPDAAIPRRSVSLGTAPAGTLESEVLFNTPLALTEGSFLGNVALPNEYNVWARACLGIVCGPAVSWPAPPVKLISVASRKVHGSAGALDVDLPLTGNPGIECRSGGANGDYTLVFTFSNPLTSVGAANLTSTAGTISSRTIDNDARKYFVNLTGVGNAQTVTVNLTNVNDAAGNTSSLVSVPMRVLIGDTNADGFVNSTDIAQTKSQSGQSLTSENFREDVTTDGNLNSTDIALVKSKSGTALP